MKKAKLTIKPYIVIERIKTHSYYTGEARKQAGYPPLLAAAIQASDDEIDQLNDHMQLSVAEIGKILSRYLAECHTMKNIDKEQPDISSIDFSLTIPQNFPCHILPQIEQAIENYITMRTLHLWLSQQKPDEANIISNETQQIVYQICEMLTMRKRPQIDKENNKNIDL